MPAIIALGSNQGDKILNLKTACNELEGLGLKIKYKSQLFQSEPVDYLDQDEFVNQVIQVSCEGLCPESLFQLMQQVEKKMKRVKKIPKGPRIIDLDLIYFNFQTLKTVMLTLPHPRALSRAFVIYPLKELPFFKELNKRVQFPTKFDHTCQHLK